jgi:RNA recognition motif-containing protein
LHVNLFQSGPERTVRASGPLFSHFEETKLMAKKLYVGNLSYSVDSSELEQLFGAHGQVLSAQVINDRDTGRSKGFGFVQMGSDEEAQAAITALNGQQHDGRNLTVNEAKPREERPRSGGGGGGGGYGGGGGGGGGGRGKRY